MQVFIQRPIQNYETFITVLVNAFGYHKLNKNCLHPYFTKPYALRTVVVVWQINNLTTEALSQMSKY